jgi:hypothetical protein
MLFVLADCAHSDLRRLCIMKLQDKYHQVLKDKVKLQRQLLTLQERLREVEDLQVPANFLSDYC